MTPGPTRSTVPCAPIRFPARVFPEADLSAPDQVLAMTEPRTSRDRSGLDQPYLVRKCSISAHHVAGGAGRNRKGHMMTVEFGFLVALVGQVRGRRAARSARRGATRSPGAAPAALAVIRGTADCRRVPGDPFVEPPHIVLARVAGERRAQGDRPPSPDRDDSAHIRAPKTPPRLQPTITIGWSWPRPSIRSLELFDRVGAWRPCSSPASSREPESPLAPARGAARRWSGRCTEAGDDQHRLAVHRPARPALAERARHPPDVPRDFAPIAARPAARRRLPIDDAPPACSEEFAPHQFLQRLGQLHPAVRRLMVLEQRHEDPRATPARYC